MVWIVDFDNNLHIVVLVMGVLHLGMEFSVKQSSTRLRCFPSSMGIALNKALWLNVILAQTTYVAGVLIIDFFERYYIDETKNKIKRKKIIYPGKFMTQKK